LHKHFSKGKADLEAVPEAEALPEAEAFPKVFTSCWKRKRKSFNVAAEALKIQALPHHCQAG
jgi:hypothetical protein